MDLDPNSFTSQQQNIDSAAFIVKRDPEKTFALVEATATASALADISAIISQQFTGQGDNSEDGSLSYVCILINHCGYYKCSLYPYISF